MAFLSDTRPIPALGRARLWLQRRGALLLGSALFWLCMVSICGTVAWIDQGATASFGAVLAAWAIGLLPWLFLTPLAFELGRASAHRDSKPAVISGLKAFALCFALVILYVATLYAWMTGQAPLEPFVQSRKLDWLWDMSIFGSAFLAGRQAGAFRQPPTRVENAPSLAVRSLDKVEYVPVETVLAASAQGNYVGLHLAGRDVLHRITLSELARQLAPHGFLRIHRSHLIRPDAVRAISPSPRAPRSVELNTGQTLPVSARYATALAAAVTARKLSA